ncbi:MAG: hypothetical protein ACRDK4_01660 [Solirubrobacteraceae bacterium]
MTIQALEPQDRRVFKVKVAGACALLVAKAHKLHDRIDSGRTDRLDDKDAADVVRLMQTANAHDVATTLRALASDPVAGRPTSDALLYVGQLFGRRGGQGIEMAAHALRTAMPADRVQALCLAFVAALTDRP